MILICHMNKNTKSINLYRTLGSIDFVGACRSMLLIKKEKGNVILEQVKNSLNKAGKSFKIVINEDGLSIEEIQAIDIDNTEDKLDIAKSFVIDILKNGEVAASKIFEEAEKAGIASSTLRRAKKILNYKSIQHDKKWYWSK